MQYIKYIPNVYKQYIMKKQQKMMLFAGLLCLICVSMSVTVGVVASAETEENEETGETTPTVSYTHLRAHET